MSPWDRRSAASRADHAAGVITSALLAAAGAAVGTYLASDGVSWTAVFASAFIAAVFFAVGAHDSYNEGYAAGFRAGVAVAPTVSEVLFAAELEGLSTYTADQTAAVEARLERRGTR